MIEINLAPPEELENHHWFVPDLAVILIFGLLSYGSVLLFLEAARGSIEQKRSEVERVSSDYKRMQPDVQKFMDLSKQVTLLEQKIQSIGLITASKIDRYMPVVLLEHLQNLKPEGVWLTELIQNHRDSVLTLSGGAVDSLYIAEFMSTLDALKHQVPSSSDIRTLIYFERVYLDRVLTGKQILGSSPNASSEPLQKAFDTTKDQSITGAQRSSNLTSGWNFFSDTEKYPVFSLVLKYGKRAAANQVLQE